MKLYPAIDVLGGRAVRLLYGKRDQVTDYGDPVDCAKRWVDEGAEILHVVDLSGAFGEEGGFEKVLERLAKLGISKEDFKPHYKCSLCNDTGYDSEGRQCQCLKRFIKVNNL